MDIIIHDGIEYRRFDHLYSVSEDGAVFTASGAIHSNKRA